MNSIEALVLRARINICIGEERRRQRGRWHTTIRYLLLRQIVQHV